MQLSELFNLVKGAQVMTDVDITSLELDSRKVTPGALFFAIKGEQYDGHAFIPDALKRGARAIIAERSLDFDIPYAVVKDARMIMGKIAKKFYGLPEKLSVIGITGTNGKTTTAFLIHSILKNAGMKPALLGTIWYVIGNAQTRAERTTPESLDVFKALHQAEQNGAQAMVMEVSSHALSLHRVDDIMFDVAVFTNLSQDHLDFHGSMDDYKRSKMHIFDLLKDQGYAIINQDDPISSEIRGLSIPKIVTYGIDDSADFTATIIYDTVDGLTIDVKWSGKKQRIASSLIGSYNAYNLLAAFTVGQIMRIGMSSIVKGIEALKWVPGRMERVGGNVFVDYAHTPDAIKKALLALRHYCTGRLFIVFGCGGDRDRVKRPAMGKIASEYADQVILTSDNPRREDPRGIIEDIKKGIIKNNVVVIEDRAQAIAEGLKMAHKGDIVLVAGKGHENYQIVGDKRIAFDDAEVIKKCFGN